MAFTLKSQREIELLRDAGRLVHQVLVEMARAAAPGVVTADLDALAEEICRRNGAECLFKGVPGAGGPFPGNICCSINDQVVHGIPGGRKIAAGDLVSLDFGVRLRGYCGDAAVTLEIGPVDAQRHLLVETTKECLDIAIRMRWVKWSKIAAAMQKCAEDRGFGVVRQFVGHGIGTEMWEDPKLPNFVSPQLLRNDIMLRKGMVLAVEPMVNMGAAEVRILEDGWTVVTKDGKPSAHFEHMLAITDDGVDVLTDGR